MALPPSPRPVVAAASIAAPAGVSELQAAFDHLRGNLRRAAGHGAVASLLALAPSWYMLEVYDRVVNSRNGLTLAMVTLAVLLAYALMAVQEWARGALLRSAGEGLDEALSARVFDAALQATRLRGNVGAIQALTDLRTLRDFMAAPAVQSLFEAPLVLLFIALLFVISPWLGGVTLLAAVVQLLLGWGHERSVSPQLREAARHGWAAQQQAERLLQAAPSIQAMGLQAAVHARWRQVQREAVQWQLRAARAAAGWQASSRLLQQSVSSLLLGLSAALLLGDRLVGGAAMLVVSGILGGRALQPFMQVLSQWPSVVQAREAWVRLNTLLKEQPAPVPGLRLPPPQGALALERVTAGAPGQPGPWLQDVSLQLPPGQVLGVIGPSGAGKSTLARVMLGLWPTLAGTVRLDGVDLAHWPKADLGPHLGYLPQDVALLDGTLADNVTRYGPADDTALRQALADAGLLDWALALPQGLNTPLGPGGQVLSGGQRQRVGLARALYGQPRLVVLDEPNAHLDEAGDQALTRLIAQRKQTGCTFVVMTHRTSVMGVVDQLLLLVQGRVQALGPRDEVMAALQRGAGAAPPRPAAATATSATTAAGATP